MTDIEHKAEYINVSELHKWENNPRTITKEELERLERSLEEDKDYFEGRPLIVSDRTGELVVIAGNQRLTAAKALGWTEVPCVVYHCKDEEEEVRRAMKDNHNNGEWDTEMLANLFSDYPLDEWLGSDYDKIMQDWGDDDPETKIVEDEPPAVSEEPPVSEMGKIYNLGGHRLMCGDSTNAEDVAKLMGDQLADLLFTYPRMLEEITREIIATKSQKRRNDLLRHAKKLTREGKIDGKGFARLQSLYSARNAR